MKKWLGFIVILVALLAPTPAMAIGVSPYIANINVSANSFAELDFNVTGCSSVDLYLEGIPLTVEPSHTPVVDGKITAKILGNLSVPSGVYTGHLVIMESGQQVGTGVKVNLTVNHINNQSVMLTATVLQPSSGWYGWSGGSISSVSDTTTAPASLPPTIPDVIPPSSVPPPATDTSEPYQPVTGEPLPRQPQTDWGMVILFGGMVLAIGLFGWYIWKKRTSIPS